MRGIFRKRPCFHRYEYILDVRILLNYFDSLSANEQLSLKILSKNAVTLLALLTAQRIQTLHLLCLADIVLNDSECRIVIRTLLKQTKPGIHQKEIVLPVYPGNKKLCVVANLQV